MSEEPFLVAHKVRGAPAFDVAIKMTCPICHDANSCGDYQGMACVECEGEGFWWIIPTSGHRAYPYFDIPIGALMHDCSEAILVRTMDEIGTMPSSLPDHYPRNPSPSRSRIDITGLLAAPAPVKIQRRF